MPENDKNTDDSKKKNRVLLTPPKNLDKMTEAELNEAADKLYSQIVKSFWGKHES